MLAVPQDVEGEKWWVCRVMGLWTMALTECELITGLFVGFVGESVGACESSAVSGVAFIDLAGAN